MAVSDTHEGHIPLMPPDKAQQIARGLMWLAQSYTEAGMVREAANATRDSQWWLAYSVSLAHIKPGAG